MDLNKLRYFYVVAKHQHVTHAAQELYISQPALTKAMQRLEEDLGIPLFHKHKRGIQLTPFGLHLKGKLDTVFSVLDRLPEELEALKDQATHTIRLNVLVASIITTDAIASYKKQNPNVNFQVLQSTGNTDCHISITVDTPEAVLPPCEQRCIIPEDIYLAVPVHGKFGALDTIDLQNVKDEPFISTSYARPFRKLSDNFCLAAGFKPNVTFESDFPSAVRNLISAGTGIGFWPAFSFGQISQDMKLLSIRSPRCQRQLVLSLYPSTPPSYAAEDFYNYLANYLQEKAKQ